MSKRRRFSADFNAHVALEAWRQNHSGDRGPSQGSSEPDSEVEEAGAGRAGLDFRERLRQGRRPSGGGSRSACQNR